MLVGDGEDAHGVAEDGEDDAVGESSAEGAARSGATELGEVERSLEDSLGQQAHLVDEVATKTGAFCFVVFSCVLEFSFGFGKDLELHFARRRANTSSAG